MTKLVRSSSGEQAARHLRRLIFNGDLRQGERIPQAEIAAALGISRIPVREAIVALQREGWLTVEAHRGAFVNGLDADAVRDHYELFGLGYGLIVRRATERCTPQQLAQIAAAQRNLRGVDDPAEFFDRYDQFLQTLFDAANTPRVVTHLEVMASLVPDGFFSVVPGAIENQLRGTAKIVRAMQRGDGDSAAAECLQTLRRLGNRVVTVLSDRGVFDDPNEAAASPS